jgi:formylglycine-generating enzyme required for sulfatase activity
MHGNVSEMCQDWHEDYGALPVVDPVRDGPRPLGRAGWRVERGGSCYDLPRSCRAAARYSRSHDHSIVGGFRVCFHVDEGT